MGGRTAGKTAKSARKGNRTTKAATPRRSSRTAKTTAPRKASRTSSGTRGATKPTLLSGGNPQIPKGDGDAPVQAFIGNSPGWKRDVARRLDALVERAVPNVRKAVRWNSPFYGIDGQGWFLSFHHFNRYVKVTFLRGAQLRPQPPVASAHPDVRYLHIHEGEQIDEPLLANWIRQAAALPGDPLF